MAESERERIAGIIAEAMGPRLARTPIYCNTIREPALAAADALLASRPDDEALVEEMARAIDPESFIGPPRLSGWGQSQQEACQRTAIAQARAALATVRRYGAGEAGVVGEIAAERRRQVEVEGWTPEHDDTHGRSELAQAAACYALSGTPADEALYIHGRWKDARDLFWPWGREWWKPKDRRRDLIRAAALIVAEIERLDRARALTEDRG